MSTSGAGLPIAKAEQVIELLPRMANRHGLIAGAQPAQEELAALLAEQSPHGGRFPRD